MTQVEYFFKQIQIEKKVLIIDNKTNQEKLFQVIINRQLVKIVFLKPHETKEIDVKDEVISMIDVVEIN
ncbi:hypothetical protein I6N95_10585 [Vagococcus sp. BWB3-3]|uniref:Uncharacterized protein n=1 Tax=Vagococcus allomyrinae TaxID=2794353 RepID=A0A940P4V0_9ENTE|nr:hypothetical protein [Vagococcus allomyrinae]MBP1041452.1 hypothetical protein [Vagococcus allomyrinae]